ncbi:MAG: MFS transporter [Hyphomicrobiales bacterium]|nr:MFS transporter [Hyphomicrobiales bacterium]
MTRRDSHLAVAAMAFFTLVDLFATQAILPALAGLYSASPQAVGFAVNASTIGMAVASLAVAGFASRVNKRKVIAASLTVLALPTAALAFAPNLAVFAALRVAQGLCMATAFALTLANISEHSPPDDVAGAFAAYVAGNVGSNLFGRLMAAAFVDHLGVAGNFLCFAALNLVGAALALRMIEDAPPSGLALMASWRRHLGQTELVAAFIVGFCILFAFVGTFSYVNFVLAGPRFGLGMMQIGFVYLVFAPSILTTTYAGALVARLGPRGAEWSALATAIVGVALTLEGSIFATMIGLALVGVGTFLAQAVATGFVGRAAKTDRGGAGAIYLASYFAGGLAGAEVSGRLFDTWGWTACQLGVLAALLTAATMAARFKISPALA